MCCKVAYCFQYLYTGNKGKNGPYVLSGGPLIFNVILFKRKAVYTEGAGPVCKCTGQCTLEGSVHGRFYCFNRFNK